METRRRILVAAMAEIGASGVVGFRIKRVASYAGIAPATIYRYFPSKSILVAEALRERGEQDAEQRAQDVTQALEDVETPEELVSAIAPITLSALTASTRKSRLEVAESLAEVPPNQEGFVASPLREATRSLQKALTVVESCHPMRPGTTPLGLAVLLVSGVFGLLLFEDDEQFDDIPAAQVVKFARRVVNQSFVENAESSKPISIPPLPRDSVIDIQEPISGNPRKRILEGAVRIISSVRGAEMEIADVAKEADVYPNTIYRYFPTRERLFAEASIVLMRRIYEVSNERQTQVTRLWKTAGAKEIAFSVGKFAADQNSADGSVRRLALLRSILFCKLDPDMAVSGQELRFKNNALSLEAFETLRQRGLLFDDFSAHLLTRAVGSFLFGRVAFDRDPEFQLSSDEWDRLMSMVMGDVCLAA